MSRLFFLIYSGISYLAFLATFLYFIGFVTNLLVPKGIDGIPELPLMNALISNLILLGVFAIQHSGMARRGFKAWWTKIIPEPIERSTYVLISSLTLALVMWKWQPMGGVVWSVSSPILSGVLVAASLLGFALILATSFMINHFDFFGLRQAWLYFRKQPYTSMTFTTRYLYQYIRHPLYLGFLIGGWAAPVMTVTHLVFAIAITGYILMGIYLEEKDLVNYFGKAYQDYQKRIPMLIPKPGRKKPPTGSTVPVRDTVTRP